MKRITIVWLWVVFSTLPIASVNAATITGFTDIFNIENWSQGSNPASANLVNTAGAPNSITLNNYPNWRVSGSGITFNNWHFAGIVSFSYSMLGSVPSTCLPSYTVGDVVKVLPAAGPRVSFTVDEDQPFGFSLNGNNQPGDFGCHSTTGAQISFVISDFTFEPNPITPGSIAVGQNYQGGIIAYIYQSGDPGYDQSHTKGIIVSAVDVATGVAWGTLKNMQGVFPCANAAATAIGSGATNTKNIITTNAPATGQYANNYAAKLASDYTSGGYTDWVLPSKDELLAIYSNKSTIGGTLATASDWYWSSSEYACYSGGSLNPGYPEISSYAVGTNFGTGEETKDVKGNSAHKSSGHSVRAIRYFAE